MKRIITIALILLVPLYVLGSNVHTINNLSSGGGSGGTTDPGGTNTQIQYNNGGSFGGFGVYDSANTQMSTYNSFIVAPDATSVDAINFSHSFDPGFAVVAESGLAGWTSHFLREGGSTDVAFTGISGTVDAPGYLSINDVVSDLHFRTYDGTDLDGDAAARIRVQATENHSVTNHGTQIDFRTTPTGGTALTQHMALTDSQVRVIDGTESSPGLSFLQDIDTGMYMNGTNQVGFSVGGAQRVSIANADILFSGAIVGSDFTFKHINDDNTNASSDAVGIIQSGGASGGDAYLTTGVSGVTNYTFGIDNSDSDNFVFARAANLDSSQVFTVSNTSLAVNFFGQVYSEQDTETQGASATHTINWDNGNSTEWDLQAATGNVTLTMTNARPGASYIIKIIQGSTARSITWPGSVKWPGGTAPTISTTNDAIDVISLYYDGNNYLATFGQDFQ